MVVVVCACVTVCVRACVRDSVCVCVRARACVCAVLLSTRISVFSPIHDDFSVIYKGN